MATSSSLQLLALLILLLQLLIKSLIHYMLMEQMSVLTLLLTPQRLQNQLVQVLIMKQLLALLVSRKLLT